MSDTPRTDKAELRYDDSIGSQYFTRSNFARQLEREIDALKQENERLKDSLDRYTRVSESGWSLASLFEAVDQLETANAKLAKYQDLVRHYAGRTYDERELVESRIAEIEST